MTSFAVGKPIATTTPSVAVDAGLPPGQHVFQLIVVDSAGNRSPASEIVVNVVRALRPTPIPIKSVPKSVAAAKAADKPASSVIRKPRKKTT